MASSKYDLREIGLRSPPTPEQWGEILGVPPLPDRIVRVIYDRAESRRLLEQMLGSHVRPGC